MSDLSVDVNNLKKQYREIFLKSNDDILHQIEKLKPKCVKCTENCNFKQDIFEELSGSCVFKKWQKEVRSLLKGDITQKLYEQWINIIEHRKNFKCTGCATCCKLACSEFSYDELKEKALKGDNFASQFVSVFVPYESEEIARAIYPEYFELLAEKADGEKVYFYHCPKVTENNRCPDYENRPQICKDFPDNPLSFLPKPCGYNKWKSEVELTALKVQALLEIIEFYKSKIPV